MSAGLQISVAEARAPYVAFERRAVEDRQASIDQGHYVSKDVDYAIVTPQGSKDQIERVASEWLEHISTESRQGRFPPEWAKAYKFAFQEWKEGRELPVDGTPVANWSVPSPAQVESMRNLRIRTVEDMANANEETISRLGMGGRNLRDLAITFLKASSPEGQSKIASDMAVMKSTLDSQAREIEVLRQHNAELASKVPNSVPQAQEQAAATSIGAGDLLDDSGSKAPSGGQQLVKL